MSKTDNEFFALTMPDEEEEVTPVKRKKKTQEVEEESQAKKKVKTNEPTDHKVEVVSTNASKKVSVGDVSTATSTAATTSSTPSSIAQPIPAFRPASKAIDPSVIFTTSKPISSSSSSSAIKPSTISLSSSLSTTPVSSSSTSTPTSSIPYSSLPSISLTSPSHFATSSLESKELTEEEVMSFLFKHFSKCIKEDNLFCDKMINNINTFHYLHTNFFSVACSHISLEMLDEKFERIGVIFKPLIQEFIAKEKLRERRRF